MLTRRAVLAGAGALMVSGCGAWARRVKEAMLCGAALPSLSAHGHIFRGKLSAFGGPAIGYLIVLPAGIDASAVHGVYYFLPGRGGGAESVAAGFAGALTDVVHSGIAPFAVATLDAGESYFHARTNGEDRGAAARGSLARAVAHHLGAPPRREAMGGYSMGGYGALLAAEREPGRYVAVACGAPALFVDYTAEDHAVGDAFDNAAQYTENDVFLHGDRLPNAVLLRIGDADPFLGAVEAFVRRYPHVRLEIGKGCHDGAFPVTTIAPLLRFAGRALSQQRP